MADVTSGFVRTDDGIQLYYRTVGSGPPLICCNGVGVSTFFWKYVAEHFRDRFTVILWDYRAHGLSGSPPDVAHAALTVERNAIDLEQVLAGIALKQPQVLQPALLFGHSMGCQVILEYAHRHPEAVRGLVPMFGTFGKPLDTFMDSRHARPLIELVGKLAKKSSRRGIRMLLPLYASPVAFEFARMTGLIDRYYADRKDIDAYMAHLGDMAPQAFFRMVELLADHDTEPYLPTITAPVLVIAGEKDLFTPLHRSRKMASLLPNAELIVLAEASHAAIVEQPDTINRRVDRFINERVQPLVSESKALSAS